MSCRPKTPGPTDYSMKSLIGYHNHEYNSQKVRAPQWSFAHKTKVLGGATSPGPANYNVGGMTRYGKMFGGAVRISPHIKSSRSGNYPGPTYDPVKTEIYKSHRAPNYAFGVRTKLAQLESGPGPVANPTPLNIYKYQAPAYPMFRKLEGAPMSRTPGPNAYDSGPAKLKVMRHPPEQSFGMRTKLFRQDKLPGPADYNLMGYNPFDQTKGGSMGIKHTECKALSALPCDDC